MQHQPQTKGIWEGTLTMEEGSPTSIRIGTVLLNPIFHFMVGKRVILRVFLHSEKGADRGQFSTVGKLEYHERKKVFLLEKYPLVYFFESFKDQRIKMEIELDQSVLSARM